MLKTLSLPNVVGVDSEKCTNCHLCIGVCPAKFCNDASNPSNGIVVNSDLCIGCGACIRACTHNARYIIDDTDRFISDLKNGENIAVLIAPAVDVNFPDTLNNLLGWFTNQGVKMNFDVSFGAEITTYQYNKALENGVNTPIIAQPCPSIVSYIEMYRPSLMKHLAPTGSPAMDMANWVHHNHPGMKLAFISPCIAKKREFEDPNTKNKIHYNVTIANLKKYFKENNIELKNIEKGYFHGPAEPDKGILYSQPGGLHEAFKRYQTDLDFHQVRRTEGIEVYEEFFDEIEKEIQNGDSDVILIDILNCIHGCNRGTGTNYNEFTTNEVLRNQSKRLKRQHKQFYSSQKNFDDLVNILDDMSNIDFSRNYTDKSSNYNNLQEPTEEIIEAINLQMGKFTEKDLKNCGACGYLSCRKMTKAILNGLYRPQQCNHFLENFYIDETGDK